MTKNSHFFYYLSMFCIMQYILVTACLFYFYEGASRFNLAHNSYSFFENFLSDLGRVVGFNGKTNVTAIFYATTLSLIGIGTLSFFIYLRNLFTKFNLSKYGFVIGLFSGISLALVGIFAVDANKVLHLFFLGVGYLLFLISLLIFNVLVYKERANYKSVFYLITGLNIALFIYVLILVFGGDPAKNIDSLFLQVIAQKIIVYSQLFVLGLVLIFLHPKKLNYISTK